MAGAWALAAALSAASSAWALPDQPQPENTTSSAVEAPLDQSIALEAQGDVGKVVVSQPDVVQVGASAPGSLYLIGRERGATNLLVYDRAGRFTQSIDVRVGYDARGLRESLEAALPDERIEVTALASGLILDGEVSNAGAAEVALRLASHTAPDAVFSRLRIRDEQVRLEVRILEVSSRRLKDIGAELRVSDGAHVDLGAGSGLIAADPPEGVATVRLEPGRYRIDARLEALETRGSLEVMARPTLTAMSGERASFRAGGEFPYPVPNGQGGIALAFKPYGTALAFQPKILSNGLIRLNLEAELSEVDSATGLRIGGFVVPGLLVRKANTTLELEEGESYLVAGLFNDTSGDTARGVPILSDLPLLGPFVRAVQGVKERRELAVVVTPRIIRAGADAEAAPAFADARTPTAKSAPRGPPHKVALQQIRKLIAPPVRWAKRALRSAFA